MLPGLISAFFPDCVLGVPRKVTEQAEHFLLHSAYSAVQTMEQKHR
jgi:hypothetical protein